MAFSAVASTGRDDDFARALRGFGPAGIAAMLLILLTGNIVTERMIVIPIGAALVLGWAWLSGTPWSAIGYARPRNWLGTIAGAIVFGGLLKLLMKAVVMPLLGADPINRSFHFLAGNRELLPAAIWGMLVAGFAEETVFRGYLFERLEKLAGLLSVSGSRSAVRGRASEQPGTEDRQPATDHQPLSATRVAIVVLTSLWFGVGHLTLQGIPGAMQATIVGLVMGTIVMTTRRIWFVMIAHAAFDLVALAIIYWDLEREIATLFFRA